MIAGLRYRWRLHKLLRNESKINYDFNNQLKYLKKQGKSDEIEELRSNSSVDFFLNKEEIQKLITTRLNGIANKLVLELPDYEDKQMWRESIYTMDQSVLTEKGIEALRSKIRAEKRERIDIFIRWATVLTGTIGALTGLLAVILH